MNEKTVTPTTDDCLLLLRLLERTNSASAWLRAAIADGCSKRDGMTIEETLVTESYLSFLTEQIELGARGVDETAEFERWHVQLSPYIGQMLLRWCVASGKNRSSIRVTPDYQCLVTISEYELAVSDD
jgi:hypothetical protein